MRTTCDLRSDGDALPCAQPSAPAPIDDAAVLEAFRVSCPTTYANAVAVSAPNPPTFCCDASQAAALTRALDTPTALVLGCPACLRNLQTFFCEFACSPLQASFVDITRTEPVRSTSR